MEQGNLEDPEIDLFAELLDDEEFLESPVVKKMASTCEDTQEHKIREYLHLTASAVKINYPKVDITTEQLIKRVESLAFHQYYDQMVRIMEMERKKQLPQEKVNYLNNLMAKANKSKIWEQYISMKPAGLGYNHYNSGMRNSYNPGIRNKNSPIRTLGINIGGSKGKSSFHTKSMTMSNKPRLSGSTKSPLPSPRSSRSPLPAPRRKSYSPYKNVSTNNLTASGARKYQTQRKGDDGNKSPMVVVIKKKGNQNQTQGMSIFGDNKAKRRSHLPPYQSRHGHHAHSRTVEIKSGGNTGEYNLDDGNMVFTGSYYQD